MLHSDQGGQYAGYDWKAFLEKHGLQDSMSRQTKRAACVPKKPNLVQYFVTDGPLLDGFCLAN